MNIKLCTFASSSSGNCTFVSGGGTNILIDAGISMKRIVKSLDYIGAAPGDLSCILVTHDHSDHVGGIRMMAKHYKIPIFATEGTGESVGKAVPEASDVLRSFSAGDEFSVGNLMIKSFRTPHDAPDSVGYRISSGRTSVAFVTDLGCVTREITEAVRGSDLAVIEANHDVEMLRNGSYPPYLKKRILSDHGHLSNTESGKLAVFLAESGTRRFVLAHLSRENNTPALAGRTVSGALRDAGAAECCAVAVAPADGLGEVYEID